MKKILALSALAMLVITTGCSNKKKDAAANNSLMVPPPQPMHPVTPVAMAPVAEPVTPVAYEPAPLPTGGGSSPQVGKTYVVQKGDTLWSIAARAYGNGQQYRKIVAANSIQGDRVNVGQRITIPQ